MQNLAAPASYRTVVRFRWLDASGHVLKGARRTSDACRQPDLRPNLSIGRIDVTPAIAPRTSRYAVIVRNGGRSPAGPFSVTLRSGAEVLAPLLVPGLAPGEVRVVRFIAAACTPGAVLEAGVDPGDEVDERREDDNVLLASCPP